MRDKVQNRLSDEAIEWLARVRAEDVTAEETADFAQWLNQSPEHKRAFDEATALWHLTQHIDSRPDSLPFAHRRPSNVGWGAGLALAAGVLLFSLVLLLNPSSDLYETGKGEQQRLLLSDGSVVHLNTNTALRIHYDDGVRSVEIVQGEAWFDVTSDPSRPFTVDGGQARIRVLGTAFVVRETPGYTRVGVTHGTVRVTPHSEQDRGFALEEGAMSTVFDSTLSRRTFDAERHLSWRQGQLVYQNERLGDLLQDLSRYVPAHMNLNDAKDLADLRVSAVLFIDDQEAMLEALARVVPIKWKQISPQSIIVTRK